MNRETSMSILLALGAAFACGVARAEDARPKVDARDLAYDRGCMICHSDKAIAPSANSTLPLAPSWPEIAKRYRARADAEDILTGIVVTGSDPKQRHWSRQAAFVAMLPNDAEVTPAQARTLVRWILSQ